MSPKDLQAKLIHRDERRSKMAKYKNFQSVRPSEEQKRTATLIAYSKLVVKEDPKDTDEAVLAEAKRRLTGKKPRAV